MAIEVLCEGCGKTLKAPDEALGKSARCPVCKAPVTVMPKLPAAPAEIEDITGRATSRAADQERDSGVKPPTADASPLHGGPSLRDEPNEPIWPPGSTWFHRVLWSCAILVMCAGVIQFAAVAITSAEAATPVDSDSSSLSITARREVKSAAAPLVGWWMLESASILLASLASGATLFLLVDVSRRVRRVTPGT